MTTPTRSLAPIAADAVTWPIDSRDGVATEKAATTLLSAGVNGILGHASPEEWGRIQGVLRSMSGFVQLAGSDDAPTGTPSRPWSQTQHFVRDPGRTAADSIRMAIDVLWSWADDAVFLFRSGDTLGAEWRLGRALQGLQDSFSPAHVERVKNEDGVWVIKDVFERPRDFSKRGMSDEEDRRPEAQTSLQELRQARVLAAHLLLSYFAQRVLGLASEAGHTRRTLERTYLRDETP